MMDRMAVASSNLASVAYDEPTSTLEIEFHNGNIYQYFDVPQHVYDQLMNAPSRGTFFNSDIRGIYRYARV